MNNTVYLLSTTYYYLNPFNKTAAAYVDVSKTHLASVPSPKKHEPKK